MSFNKMVIKAYKTNEYLGNGIGSCKVGINPSSYNHNFSVRYNNTTGVGKSGSELQFKGTPPETIQFEINFDATGAIPGNTSSIRQQIDTFKNICFKYNGNIHEPNFLIVSWGTLVFKGKLTNMAISYTLFKPDGSPLRAKANVTFEEALSNKQINKAAGNNSPDLTHLIIVEDGDTLPVLCNRVYGTPNYYAEVANYNNFVNFRNLIPGQKIYFPPLK